MSSVAVADINSDGEPDIIALNGCDGFLHCFVQGSIGILLGNGDGTFQHEVTYSSAGWQAASVAIADVNSDAKLDLLVAHGCTTRDLFCPSNASVGVLLGNGCNRVQAKKMRKPQSSDACKKPGVESPGFF